MSSCVYDPNYPSDTMTSQKINGNKPREDIYIGTRIQEEIKAAFIGSKAYLQIQCKENVFL